MLAAILRKEGYTEIPLHKTGVGLFTLEVSIDGIATNFLLDTGAGNTVVDEDFARENSLQLSQTNLKGGGVGTSELGLHKMHIQNFKLEKFNINEFELYAADFKHVKDSLRKKGISNPANGVVGADILIPHKAIIDYGSEKLYLKP